jgi:hypothetical protein
VLLSVEGPALNGAPSLPFYRPREGPRVHGIKREKEEKKKEKTEREGALGLRRPSPLQVGLASPADDNDATCRCSHLGHGAPVHHWRYRQAPPFCHGASSRLGVRYGQ